MPQCSSRCTPSAISSDSATSKTRSTSRGSGCSSGGPARTPTNGATRNRLVTVEMVSSSATTSTARAGQADLLLGFPQGGVAQASGRSRMELPAGEGDVAAVRRHRVGPAGEHHPGLAAGSRTAGRARPPPARRRRRAGAAGRGKPRHRPAPRPAVTARPRVAARPTARPDPAGSSEGGGSLGPAPTPERSAAAPALYSAAWSCEVSSSSNSFNPPVFRLAMTWPGRRLTPLPLHPGGEQLGGIDRRPFLHR